MRHVFIALLLLACTCVRAQVLTVSDELTMRKRYRV